MPTGTAEIDLRLVSQSEYIGEEIEDAVYTWSLEPSAAGTITNDGHHAFVVWDGEYRGQVSISYAYANPCGSTSVSESLGINVFNSTGMDEQDISAVKVYPNPAKDMIHIETNFDGNATLRIIDLMGKVVYECEIQDTKSGPSTDSGTATIATSKFDGRGLYTLQVIQNDSVTNVRIIVMP